MLLVLGSRDYTASMVQPTKIHGRPTYLQLRRLEKELTKSAASIHSDKGGGAHGYVGLLKSTADYEKIAPDTPFNMPVAPPPLVIPERTTAHKFFRLQQDISVN